MKIGDVDSTWMLLRVERGKGGRDPNAMLSAEPLALLREWWIEGHRQGILHREGWLFPGLSWDRPLSANSRIRLSGKASPPTRFTASSSRRRGPPKSPSASGRACYAVPSPRTFSRTVSTSASSKVLLGHAELHTTALHAKVGSARCGLLSAPLIAMPCCPRGTVARLRRWSPRSRSPTSCALLDLRSRRAAPDT
ncbi:hypothetical protein [Aureimonas sp. N4]|uniref:hypothetical protein n=1 Tax=Aureimonas sp. N4 TaxID=1638165 RepID=UPI00178C87B4|nr:hypothetical protein [Aureimonas sp. N4]